MTRWSNKPSWWPKGVSAGGDVPLLHKAQKPKINTDNSVPEKLLRATL